MSEKCGWKHWRLRWSWMPLWIIRTIDYIIGTRLTESIFIKEISCQDAGCRGMQNQ